MAFPSKHRTDDDPGFLKPYDPAQFGEGQVHVERGNGAGFLFRVEPQPGGSALILVLSAGEPDWDYAFHNAQHLLAGPPAEPRPLQLTIETGRRFRFRLLANPTKRPPLTKAQWLAKKQAGEKVKRPRMQITWKEGDDPAETFAGWLCSKGGRAGFRIDPKEIEVSNIGYVHIRKGKDDDKVQRLRSARFDGILEVTDADAFAKTLAAGIGPAKGFGFGLLSVAPVSS
jgi:CRISPR system Cascade subunit CasE